MKNLLIRAGLALALLAAPAVALAPSSAFNVLTSITATISGTVTAGKLALTGTGSTGDVSGMSVAPNATAPAGTLAKQILNALPSGRKAVEQGLSDDLLVSKRAAAGAMDTKISDRWKSTCLAPDEFGAYPDDGIEDTSAFNAMYAAAGTLNRCVRVPSGRYELGIVNVGGTNNITTYCDGFSNGAPGGSKFVPVGMTGDMFVVGYQAGTWFRGCSWQSKAFQTAGSFVRFMGTINAGLSDFSMIGGYDPLVLDSQDGTQTNSATTAKGTAEIYALRGAIRDWGRRAITINGGHDQFFQHIIADNATDRGQESCFYTEQNGGSIVIDGGDYLHCHNGLWINPGPGQFVSWLYASNTYFDTMDFTGASGTGVGIKVTPHGTAGGGNNAIVNGLRFQNVWSATAQVNMQLVGNAYSTLTDIQATNLHLPNAYQQALVVDYADNVSILNPGVSGASNAAAGSYSAVLVGAHNYGLTLVGGYVGGPANNYPARHKFNIEVASGHTGLLNVSSTNLQGATAAPTFMPDDATLAPGSGIMNSPGVNTGAISTVTAGSSPWYYTAGLTNETLYVYGGTNLQITFGSDVVCPAGSTVCIVNLAPRQVAGVSYSGGTPTAKRQLR